MSQNLVIVESPAKAKTISKFLGPDYEVVSSYGHIRDLPKKGMSIDIKNDFKPDYAIPLDKAKVAEKLVKSAKKSPNIWLATDEDREGEAIAWHILKVLGLKSSEAKRIVFHEITKDAILKAIKKPRKLDSNLVNAQQARRVLDRLVGYELSPLLWKKVRPKLSAGRVQSVAVRLIVEREREIENFKPETAYKVTAEFKTNSNQAIPSELNKKIDSLKSVKDLFNDIKRAHVTIKNIEQKPGVRNPSPPFITSTLQQEASRKLGYSVKQTMTLAQKLYENGHITYMRTDSLNLAKSALAAIKKHIESEFGSNYVQVRTFKTKNQLAQEAHEAIRPTRFNVTDAGTDEKQKKLYRLIYQRTVASQMAPAKVQKTQIDIDCGSKEYMFIAKGEVIIFDGFLRIYDKSTLKEFLLPSVSIGDNLKLHESVATETQTKPPARYTEASLVKKLEELGIGRPSTYAPTISTIHTRGYVQKGEFEGKSTEISVITLKGNKISEKIEEINTGSNRGKIIPTDIGKIVNDFLSKHFSDIVDYDFTAQIEEEFDDIAMGKKEWQNTIKLFYKPFHSTVVKSEKVPRAEVSGARELGVDPKSKLPVFAKFGRFGPVLQRGNGGDDDSKPEFAPMPPGSSLEEVELEEALKMFTLPRKLGKTDSGEQVLVDVGPYGPYIKHGASYVSIGSDELFKITREQAIDKIKHGASSTKSGVIKEFKEDSIQVKHGRYGPYVTDGTTNARIPKEITPRDINLEQAKNLLTKAQLKTEKRALKNQKTVGK
ncbi:type I DNA topoisomerase [Candidatus Saccharibacteria bacterium CPR2]|nr:type I DNA topoisomerase [Candidatus Saccharibacteria bacterium CPR2]